MLEYLEAFLESPQGSKPSPAISWGPQNYFYPDTERDKSVNKSSSGIAFL